MYILWCPCLDIDTYKYIVNKSEYTESINTHFLCLILYANIYSELLILPIRLFWSSHFSPVWICHYSILMVMSRNSLLILLLQKNYLANELSLSLNLVVKTWLLQLKTVYSTFMQLLIINSTDRFVSFCQFHVIKYSCVCCANAFNVDLQILPFANAFYRGLIDLISPSWLSLFNASEFNQVYPLKLIPLTTFESVNFSITSNSSLLIV